MTMVIYCVAFGCKNEQDKRKNISFHGFPLNRPELLKLWINAVRRDNWAPSKTSKLCGEHFLPSDYLDKPGCTAKLLKPTAVPSVFSYTKTSLAKVAESNGKMEKQDGSDQSRSDISALPQSLGTSSNIGGLYKRCDCSETHDTDVMDSDENQKQCTERTTRRIDGDTDTASENEQEYAPKCTKSWSRGPSTLKRYIGDFKISDMDDPVKAKQYWYISRKRLNNYKAKVRMLSQYSRRLNNRLAYQKTLLKMAKEEDETHLFHVLPEETESAKKKTIWVIKCGV